MPRAILESRTVPVQEDLTTESNELKITRGIAEMFRVDIEVEDGVDLLKGEWGVLNANGKLERPGATPVANTYLVFQGTDRFDVSATGKVGIIQNSSIVAETTRFDPAGTYNPGVALTVKDLGAGEAFLTVAAGTDPILGRVVSLGGGLLKFESRQA